MGDAPARTELKVTTGAIRGSRKIHVGPLGVAMRAVDLEPSSGEPPVWSGAGAVWAAAAVPVSRPAERNSNLYMTPLQFVLPQICASRDCRRMNSPTSPFYRGTASRVQCLR